jgi:hypothetical protein
MDKYRVSIEKTERIGLPRNLGIDRKITIC